MNQITKMTLAIILIGFIGFILGAAANLLYVHVFPTLIKIFPQILESEWIIWGLIGALLAILCCLIYASLP